MKKISLEKVETLDFRTREAYKTLRSNIGFCGKDVKVIAMTSTAPNEGKSNVALHLAMSMAEAGYQVCFIDADLRKSVLIGKYKVGKVENGLTNFLSGQCKWDECIYECEQDNLHCVFAGPVPPNPSELLNSVTFTEQLAKLKETYDYVIIDTPPLGSVIDGAVVASKCDGAVMVVEYNRISARLVRKAKAQLEKTGCKVLGAVLNKVDKRNSSYYEKSYEKYYK